jgi:hypothetical protein
MVRDGWGGARCWAVLAVAVAMSFAAGCAASTDPTSPLPGPTTQPPVTSQPTAEEIAREEALAAYQGMWADFVEAGATSDWQSPNLGRHAMGVALTNLSRGLYADSVNGLVTKGKPVLSPVVSSVEPLDDPTRVVVTDCGDSAGWLKYREADGSRASENRGGRRLINAVVERQPDGAWKVTDFGVQELGSC